MLATSIAILLGSGQMLATQAAVSAALVATLQPLTDGVTFARFLDALVGGAVALIVSGLLLPADPVAMVRRAARPLLEELAATLDDIAAAIVERDRERAEAALLRARGIDELSALVEAVEVSRETTCFAPPRRRLRGRVEGYAEPPRISTSRSERPRARSRHDPRRPARRERAARDRRRGTSTSRRGPRTR